MLKYNTGQKWEICFLRDPAVNSSKNTSLLGVDTAAGSTKKRDKFALGIVLSLVNIFLWLYHELELALLLCELMSGLAM